MSIFRKAIQNYSTTQSVPISSENWFNHIYGTSKKGVVVNEETIRSIAALNCGVNIIANHVSSLPLEVLRRDSNGKTVDNEHRLNEILKYQANPYKSANHFKRQLMFNMLLNGNGIARIERDGNSIRALYIEHPKNVKIRYDKKSGSVFYQFKGIDKEYAYRDVIHIYEEANHDGFAGLSLIQRKAKEAFAGHISAQRFSRKYFENNAHAGGLLTTEFDLDSNVQGNMQVTPQDVEKTKSLVRAEFERMQNGAENWFAPIILDGDWNYEQLEVKASDAMLIERMNATVEDVSRWLQIPLSLVNHTDSQSYKSKEQEYKAYIANCLRPKLDMLQLEFRNKLFTENEKRAGYEIFIDEADIGKANLEHVTEHAAKMVNSGIWTINQALEYLGNDTEEGLDIRLIPKNMSIMNENKEIETIQEDEVDNLRNALKQIVENNKNGHNEKVTNGSVN